MAAFPYPSVSGSPPQRLSQSLSFVTAVGASADPTIPEKRAQAQAIIAEVQQLDSDLSKTIEAYNLEAIELDRIDTDIATNGRHLVAARKSLGVAQRRVADDSVTCTSKVKATPRWRSSLVLRASMKSSLDLMRSSAYLRRTPRSSRR